jgi:hypothetical protein
MGFILKGQKALINYTIIHKQMLQLLFLFMEVKHEKGNFFSYFKTNWY